MMVNCDTVKVTFDHEESGRTTLVVPTYTRTEESFKEKIEDYLQSYLKYSHGKRVSIGDFAMLLMSYASLEPKTQEEEG